ncbi:hypothetical protein GCM10010211_16470 [Streptomyces albospinus]|uniref:Uncharacterized protein n=1 Tax=Streptomyces albospinus TaxID=285515 RepID=A0ABQ2UT96_9ACTN|nr:hypothetical protein GCM10010211_16470 [Streptomyces albospinus]
MSANRSSPPGALGVRDFVSDDQVLRQELDETHAYTSRSSMQKAPDGSEASRLAGARGLMESSAIFNYQVCNHFEVTSLANGFANSRLGRWGGGAGAYRGRATRSRQPRIRRAAEHLRHISH